MRDIEPKSLNTAIGLTSVPHKHPGTAFYSALTEREGGHETGQGSSDREGAFFRSMQHRQQPMPRQGWTYSMVINSGYHRHPSKRPTPCQAPGSCRTGAARTFPQNPQQLERQPPHTPTWFETQGQEKSRPSELLELSGASPEFWAKRHADHPEAGDTATVRAGVGSLPLTQASHSESLCSRDAHSAAWPASRGRPEPAHGPRRLRFPT